MPDTVTTIGGTTIQHGPHSNRVYVMHLDRRDMPSVIPAFDTLAAENGYTKIFAKVPEAWRKAFARAGYTEEACVPGFFGGRESVCFMSLFRDKNRGVSHNLDREEKFLTRTAGPGQSPAPHLPRGYAIRQCVPEDVSAMASLYREVFETYPFPITDPRHLTAEMSRGTVFLSICRGYEPVALASAEVDAKESNAEITDFATLPAFRGRGFARRLLIELENILQRTSILTAYTIARACSDGMNAVFSGAGYTWAGRLINNTNIGGGLEDMNVWYRKLPAAGGHPDSRGEEAS